MEGSQQLEVEDGPVNDVDSSFLIALEELRNLRPQLLTAAEYCEQQYLASEQKDSVTDNLREYAVKALVNMVDHLGTVAYKLNLCIDQESTRTESLESQLMTLQQRVASMRTYMEQDAAEQQQQPKTGQRMVKQYRVPDETAEAAFVAAQFFVEMPRETFDFEERTFSESLNYSSQPAVPVRRSAFGRRRSDPTAAREPGLRRAASSASHDDQGGPTSPTSISTFGGGSTVRSTGTPHTGKGNNLEPSVPVRDCTNASPMVQPMREQASQNLSNPEPAGILVPGPQAGKSSSKIRKMLSRVLSR